MDAKVMKGSKKRGRKANQERTTFEAPIENDVFKAYRNQV